MLDKNCDGCIAIDELQMVLTRESQRNQTVLYLTDTEIADFIGYADTNGDEKLSFQEFAPLWQCFCEEYAKKPIDGKRVGRRLISSFVSSRGRGGAAIRAAMTPAEAFAMFDEDGSGSITVEELKQVLLRNTGNALSIKEVDAIIAEVDVNCDGALQLDEFANMWVFFQDEVTPRRENRQEGAAPARKLGGRRT